MSLSWSEIRDNAIAFQERWKNTSGNERSEAQTFLYELLRDVYGVDPRRVGTFEKKVHPSSDSNGYIDMLWPGRILIEMKSKGKSLDKAHDQARKYAFSIENDEDLPEFIMVCDFENIRLYNLITNQEYQFKTSNLADNVHALSILTDQATKLDLIVDKELNTQAAYKMARLHDKLKENRYTGHDLEVYLVRILFCLFADHTGIFSKRQFYKYILASNPNGSDLAGRITTLFEVLNTPITERMVSLSDELKDFPYVDGKLFEENLRSASFSSEMVKILVECCEFDWSAISPAIFGAMFQSVMDPQKRITLGEQYTPHHIIKKVLKPLMIDELYTELAACQGNFTKLEGFHDRIAKMKFLDPACGCGNFLIVAYAALRRLELDLLRLQYPSNESLPEDFDLDSLIRVNVNQFYGFEIEEFPCQIAQAGMWLIDHKMNVEASVEFGNPFIRIPLKERANIHCVNSLTTNWNDIIPNNEIDYIFGNPPFYGAKKLTASQRREVRDSFENYQNAGLLDYVCAWYITAAKYIQGTKIKVAFVSTNSIIQGEQVAVLWDPLIYQLGIEIEFAYRPFKWTNEARDVAVVRCVIIGFHAYKENREKTIYNADGDTISVPVINPYLDGFPEITLICRRNTPLCSVPIIGIGNKPIDNGNYLFTKEEMEQFIREEPKSEKWFRPWYGSREFINKCPRYCLWLGDCPPNELSRMPKCLERVEAVKTFRLQSSSPQTRAIATKPRRFHVENMPSAKYLVIPEVSSERREYIPMGFMNTDVLCSNLVKIMPNATLYHFGILTSSIHMIWTRAVCGRLEERYRYSIEVVYNNFPWPNPTTEQKQKIEALAQKILDVREEYPNSTYAELYNPGSMPTDLSQAHSALDKQVKKLYGLNSSASDTECIVELYKRYREHTLV